jgi:hypothetical protein
MENIMIKIYCEWDVGQEYLVFPSEDLAYSWLRENVKLQAMAKDDGMTIEEYLTETFDEGLLGYDQLTIVREV